MNNGKLKYPDEVIEFVKENYGEYGLTMLPIINEKFGINMTRDYLLGLAYNRLHLKSYHTMDTDYTKEEESWMVDNIYSYKTLKEFVEDYNKTFPRINRTYKAMGVKLRKMGLSTKLIRKEELDWLRENGPYHTAKALSDMHNKVFQKQRTRKSIISMAKAYGIKIFTDKDSRIIHYNKSDNKKVCEVGHVRLEKGDEYIKVVKNSSSDIIPRKDMWIKRTRYEYERQYGVKPGKWECVIQLDGDKTNYSKENLYLVPNYINGYILQYLGKLIKDQPELNKAHILRFEVEKAIKDYEKKNKNFKEWRKNMNEYDPVNEGGKE